MRIGPTWSESPVNEKSGSHAASIAWLDVRCFRGSFLEWRSMWRLLHHLRIGLAMNDSPTIGLPAEKHGHPVIPRRFLFLPRNVETDMFDLDHISQRAIRCGHDPLNRIGALGKLRAYPIQATANRLPTVFDRAPKSSRQSDIISMGPKCLERFRSPVLKFPLRCVNPG